MLPTSQAESTAASKYIGFSLFFIHIIVKILNFVQMQKSSFTKGEIF